MMRFWNNLHQIRSRSNYLKAKGFKCLWEQLMQVLIIWIIVVSVGWHNFDAISLLFTIGSLVKRRGKLQTCIESDQWYSSVLSTCTIQIQLWVVSMESWETVKCHKVFFNRICTFIQPSWMSWYDRKLKTNST